MFLLFIYLIPIFPTLKQMPKAAYEAFFSLRQSYEVHDRVTGPRSSGELLGQGGI